MIKKMVLIGLFALAIVSAGGAPLKGLHYKSIRNSNIEVVVMHALRHGKISALQVLFKEHNLDHKTYGVGRTKTIYQMALEIGDSKSVDYLINLGADPNHVFRYGETALMTAAKLDRVNTINVLLGHGAKTEEKDYFTVNALLHAASLNRYGAVHALLKGGADVNAIDKWGSTPLYHAVGQQSPELVDLLLQHGADPTIETAIGDTALERAEWWENHNIVKKLKIAIAQRKQAKEERDNNE